MSGNRSVRTGRSRVGTSIALALISFPAVVMWGIVSWAAIDASKSGRIGEPATLAALAGLAFFAGLLTLLASIGWRKRRGGR